MKQQEKAGIPATHLCTVTPMSKTDECMRTNVPGVFAAGDVRVTPLRQVVTACADGAIAAMQCYKYISAQK